MASECCAAAGGRSNSGMRMLSSANMDAASTVNDKPFVVDLDGTLIRSDILIESAFAGLGANFLNVFGFAQSALSGKAALKEKIAHNSSIDVSILPYNEQVLDAIRKRKEAGQPVYLASASNERFVEAVAEHLGIFDGWLASTGSENLSSHVKARRLVEMFGEKGFDYIGNDKADLAVWAAARDCLAFDPAPSTLKRLREIAPEASVMTPERGGLRAWLKLLRVHQWSKNALVFVPLLTAHRFDLPAVLAAIGAFIAFSLAASAIYVINDLVDLEADRNHPSKFRRPLAAGTVPILRALFVPPIFLLAALGLAVLINIKFVLVVFGYIVLTTAYSFDLKRRMIVDIVTLASLYTVRVIGGAMAIAVPLSEWLLAFSMFIFTALALIKRYVEMAARVDADLPDPSNRNYRKTDLPIIAVLAGAAGFNAVTVFAIFISSDNVKQLYSHPLLLWLACPILLYWVSRALMLAHRRLMDDDPILFALKDRNSLLAFALIAIIMIVAI